MWRRPRLNSDELRRRLPPGRPQRLHALQRHLLCHHPAFAHHARAHEAAQGGQASDGARERRHHHAAPVARAWPLVPCSAKLKHLRWMRGVVDKT